MSCAEASHEQSWFGARTMTNHGDSAAVIETVSLMNDSNITLYESVLVPEKAPGRTLITGVPFDQTGYGKPHYQWDQRVSAVGATLKPGVSYELVLRIGVHGTGEGMFNGVMTTYSYAGKTFAHKETTRSAVLGLKTPECPDEFPPASDSSS